MASKLKSNFGMEGRVKIRILNKRGTCLKVMESSNSITFTGPLIVMDLLAQTAAIDHPANINRGFAADVPTIDTPGLNKLGYFGVGTGTSAASRNFTDLDNPVALVSGGLKAISSLTFPSNSELQVTTTFESGDANVSPSEISEVGLYTIGNSTPAAADSDRRLFARQIHGGIEKTAAIVLEYTWTLIFS